MNAAALLQTLSPADAGAAGKTAAPASADALAAGSAGAFLALLEALDGGLGVAATPATTPVTAGSAPPAGDTAFTLQMLAGDTAAAPTASSAATSKAAETAAAACDLTGAPAAEANVVAAPEPPAASAFGAQAPKPPAPAAAPHDADDDSTDADDSAAPEDSAATPIDPAVLAVAQSVQPQPRASAPGANAGDHNGAPAPAAPLSATAPANAPAATEPDGAAHAAPEAGRQKRGSQPNAPEPQAPTRAAAGANMAGFTAAEALVAPAASGHAALAGATTPARAGGALPPAADAVAQQIVRRFDGGSTQFEIRLDPPELGRVDVRIEVSHDKKVTATIAADNPQTLRDLVSTSRELQRALTEAGVDLADNGLSFSDRRGGDGAPQRPDPSPLRGRASDDEPVSAPLSPRPLGVERWRGAGVDMLV